MDITYSKTDVCPDCSDVCNNLEKDISTFMSGHPDMVVPTEPTVVVSSHQCPDWQKYLAFSFIVEHMVILISVIVYCCCCRKK